jgi:hypothetical protein
MRLRRARGAEASSSPSEAASSRARHVGDEFIK